jgi:hypothetical protein
MKKIIIILSFLILSLGLFAQESPTLEELRLYVKTALLKGEQIGRSENTKSIVIGEILYEDNETPLGELIYDLITAEVVNSSTLNISLNPSQLRDEGSNWYLLEGVIHKVENSVYMQLKIENGLDRTPLAIIEKTLDYASLAQLLTVANHDDYYDVPMVTDDYFMEPNDDSFSSVEYILGESLELALTPGDVDWFYFTTDMENITGDALMVELFTTGETDTYMTIYGPDDPTLYYGESDDYIDSNAGMSVTFDESGTYWVALSGYSEETSGYYYLESGMDSVDFVDDYEPNNIRDKATLLMTTDNQEHAFGVGDNMDVFRFTMDDFGEIVLYTEGMMDTYIDLYDVYGNYIGSDDDGGKDSNARLEIDLNRGTYFLEVSPYDDGTSGSYRIITEVE